MAVEIQAVGEVTDELVAGLAGLVTQLSKSAPPLSREVLQDVVSCSTNTVLVACVDGRLSGTLTLVMFPIPTGLRGRIEDVVVDSTARGSGVGAALVARAVELATVAGARSVDLTSRPSRAVANRLYERLGFERRESIVYRWASPG